MAMDDVGWDLLGSLHPDVVGKILTCLDDPGDIVRASSVSRAWRDFVVSNGICKQLCFRLFPLLCGISRIVDTSNSQQRKCSDVGSSRSAEMEYLKMEHMVFAYLVQRLTSSDVGECLSDALGASSTDNFPEESVRNTLEPLHLMGRRASYWSSSGQSNPEVPERLTYKLTSDICVITEINIQPFQALFQADDPIYSAKAVRFHMGYRVFLDNDEEVEEPDFENGLEGPPSTNKHYVWTYTSKEFPMTQENTLQHFKLPEPVLCIGGVVQIELLGRVQRQEMDGLFYICVAYVQVKGRSLGPVFSIDSIEPSGKFLLKYNPDAEFSLPCIQEESYEVTTTPEMVQRHDRGWEHILNMLRGTLGVDIYDSEDDHHDSDEDLADEDMADDFVA